MSNCCHQPEPKPEEKHEHQASCHADHSGGKKRPDYLLWVSGSIVLLSYVLYWFVDGHPALPQWLITMTSGIYELMNRMWWGLVAAVFFVGLLDRVPRELVMSALGRGGTLKGIGRATLAGLMLDLCSHGILMVGAKLYERGASIGQLMAFLIASPWNSLSLTIILFTLIGWQWTLAFIALSMAIGMVTGLMFDRLVQKGVLPENPHHQALEENTPLLSGLVALCKKIEWTPRAFGRLFWDGLKGSAMVFRWLFFGIVLATLIRAFVPMELYQSLFGPTIAGLFLTLLAATIIEVCSEGSTPIAADIVTRAAAPGNGFAFLMAGVATDYTEIMVLKDVTKSWKIALFLPLLTFPQVVLIGWVLNSLGGG